MERFTSAEDETDDDAEARVVAPWIAAKSVLSPLLHAYDDRIAELTKVSKECAGQLESVTAELKVVSEENERLREELAKKYEGRIGVLARESGGNPADGLPRGSLEGSVEDLDEQLSVVLKENAVLTDQVALFEAEVLRLSNEGKVWCEEIFLVSKVAD